MIILNAIQQLLKFKGFATINEVAQIAELKKAVVLECFNNNRDLLKVDKRGRIEKITTWEREFKKQNELFRSGKLFKTGKINYGVDSALYWENNEEADKLKVYYTHGGLGDCWTTKELLDTAGNRKKLEDLGMIFYEDLHKDYDTIEKCWKE